MRRCTSCGAAAMERSCPPARLSSSDKSVMTKRWQDFFLSFLCASRANSYAAAVPRSKHKRTTQQPAAKKK